MKAVDELEGIDTPLGEFNNDLRDIDLEYTEIKQNICNLESRLLQIKENCEEKLRSVSWDILLNF